MTPTRACRTTARARTSSSALCAKESARISDLQRVLYADASHALLIVLQGRDASGKDGTIRKVFSAVNPQGCTVSSFKEPTDTRAAPRLPLARPQQVPPKGMIGIFNRSHYEDILVPRVHGLFPKKVWSARYDQINDFERMLAENGVVILKFMLHISRDEQKSGSRSASPTKRRTGSSASATSTTGSTGTTYTKAYRGMLAEDEHRVGALVSRPRRRQGRPRLPRRAHASPTPRELDLHYPPPDPALDGLEIV